jgi:hypothetical protein
MTDTHTNQKISKNKELNIARRASPGVRDPRTRVLFCWMVFLLTAGLSFGIHENVVGFENLS